MRIRWGIGLPGPFYATGGRSRRPRRRGPGCLAVLLVALALGLSDTYWWVAPVAVVSALAACIAWMYVRR